jgi:hypothetical protein
LTANAIQTVVLTVEYSTRSSYYLDWLDAFHEAPQFAVTAFNLFRRGERAVARRAIETAELIVALHSCSADTLEYIEPLAGALKARRGRLVAFIGNEYNSPWAPLGDKRRFIASVGADYVATQLLLEAGKWLYEGTGARVVALPHALNDAAFRREKDDADRKIDVGGRSAQYPNFLGDDDRNQLYDAVRRCGPKEGLTVDVETTSGSRLSRPDWAAFLNDCRGTIGTEAGTWFLERDDRSVLEIREFLRQCGGSRTLRADRFAHSLARRLPYGAKEALRALLKWSPLRHEAIGDDLGYFAEVQARFFTNRPRAPVYGKCISSRHFDAAGTGTCQLLIRGRYNDILQADEHYLAFDPDLANLDDVIARFRDPGERKRVANNAYELIRDAHTHHHRLQTLLGHLQN